jgi:hypothetical protein
MPGHFLTISIGHQVKTKQLSLIKSITPTMAAILLVVDPS